MSKFTMSFAVAVSLLAGSLAPPALAADSSPIRLGFLTIKSGALAAGGKQMEDGLRLFLKERNNMIAGRKVELFVADTAGQPAITKTKAQELVEKDKVQVIIGPLAAFEALAIDDYIRSTQTPIISPSAAAEDLTQRKPNPWFVRAVGTSAQPNHPLGEYAARTLKYRRIAIIADDFAFGHEIAAGFQRTFEDNGGKIVQKLWSPLNVADYGTYIGQIKPDVDAVFALQGVGDVLRGDRTERLALIAGLQGEDQGDRIEPRRERLGIGMTAVLLGLHARALLRDTLQLAGARLDGEALGQKEVLGIAIGDVLDVTGAAEAADLLFQDDAHGAVSSVSSVSATRSGWPAIPAARTPARTCEAPSPRPARTPRRRGRP